MTYTYIKVTLFFLMFVPIYVKIASHMLMFGITYVIVAIVDVNVGHEPSVMVAQ